MWLRQCSLEKHPGPATMRRRESGPGSVPCQSRRDAAARHGLRVHVVSFEFWRQHSRRSTAKPSLNTGAGKDWALGFGDFGDSGGGSSFAQVGVRSGRSRRGWAPAGSGNLIMRALSLSHAVGLSPDALTDTATGLGAVRIRHWVLIVLVPFRSVKDDVSC